jgi:hypothetical protein
MTEHSTSPRSQQVVVTDVRMPFFSMVTFMVKWTLASIPAMIILAIVGGVIAAIGTTFFAVIAGLLGGLAASM